jgi:hypothetical protein
MAVCNRARTYTHKSCCECILLLHWRGNCIKINKIFIYKKDKGFCWDPLCITIGEINLFPWHLWLHWCWENAQCSKGNVTHSVMCSVTQAVCLCMTLLFGMSYFVFITRMLLQCCVKYMLIIVCRSVFINWSLHFTYPNTELCSKVLINCAL